MNEQKKKANDWTFKQIEGGFDSHVREQLPWYDLTCDMISFIVRNYAPKNAVIYDIGASTGHVKDLLKSIIQERNIEYITIDNEENMHPDILADACTISYKQFDVAILNLTLMFIPVKNRKLLLTELKAKMNDGGCIIVVDKLIQPQSYLSNVLRRLTLWWKHNNKVDGNMIVEKELSLSGVQVPIYKHELGECEQFFQFGEFAGFVIHKQ